MQVPKRTMSSALTSQAQLAQAHPATKRPDRERDLSRCTVASTESAESFRSKTTTGGTLSPRCSSRNLRGFTRRADPNQSDQLPILRTAIFPLSHLAMGRLLVSLGNKIMKKWCDIVHFEIYAPEDVGIRSLSLPGQICFIAYLK